MIIEWIIGIGMSFGKFMATLFPVVDIPDWIEDPLDAVYGFLDSASGLGIWFPWAVLSIVIGTLVTVFIAGLGTKLIREIAKHLPFVGGGG